jgi:lysozyme
VKNLIEMLKHHEGVRYQPYQCPARLWSVGVGRLIDPAHLRVPFEDRLSLPIPQGWDRTFSEAEVDALLQEDLARFLDGVRRLCTVAPLSNRHLALTSFAFNVGLGNLQNSTLRQKHNRGDHEGASNEFLKWNKGGGRVLPGLETRRKDERAMYLA